MAGEATAMGQDFHHSDVSGFDYLFDRTPLLIALCVAGSAELSEFGIKLVNFCKNFQSLVM